MTATWRHAPIVRATNSLPGGSPVRYSLWMHGRMVGETTFDLYRSGPKMAGMFLPTEYGSSVIHRVTAMAPALFAFGELCRQAGFDLDDSRRETAAAALEQFGAT